MAVAIFPNGIFAWSPRIDQQSTVLANDPNTLATELQAVETFIGTQPQIESAPAAGTAVTYASMSARLSAANSGQNLPYVVLSSPGFFIQAGQQSFNAYQVVQDPYKIWNGQDVTIPANGYWSFRADQKWNQKGNNFRGGNVLFLVLNGNTQSFLDAQIWDWSAAFANSAFNYANNVFQSNGYSRVTWEGLLHKGDRLQVLSANSTFCPGIQITNMTFKGHMVRTVSGTFTSG